MTVTKTARFALCKLLETWEHEVPEPMRLVNRIWCDVRRIGIYEQFFTILSKGVVVGGNGPLHPILRIPDPACSDRRHPGEGRIRKL